jgi:hypothetical protein
MVNPFKIGLGVLAVAAGPALAQTGAPYQHQVGINTPCTNNQCIMTFPAVPAGRRLVLASVSAQLGTVLSSFVLEGSGVAYFVPKANPANGTIAQPIMLYYNAGQQPTARVFAPPGTPSTSIIVTLVGQLQPVP